MIEPLNNLEGLCFGKAGRYKILSSLGVGGEGQVFGLETEIGEIKAVKMIPFRDQHHKICTTWTMKQIDFRKRYLFNKHRSAETQWVEQADEDSRKSLVETLKQFKEQAEIHRNLKSLTKRMLIPPIEEYGVLLIPSDGDHGRASSFPVVYAIMPLIMGQTLSRILSMIDQYHQIQPFIYRSPGRTPTTIVGSYKKLAEQCVESLLRGVASLYRAGFLVGIDIHMDNVMYGRLFGQDKEAFFIVDVNPYQSRRRENFKQIIESILSLGGEILIWDFISSWHADIQKDRFYMKYELSKIKKRLKRDYSSCFKKRMKELVRTACKNAWPEI